MVAELAKASVQYPSSAKVPLWKSIPRIRQRTFSCHTSGRLQGTGEVRRQRSQLTAATAKNRTKIDTKVFIFTGSGVKCVRVI